jgi:hypothetical protein
MIDANDPRVRFVGLDTYLNEGGLLQKDLFQADHEGYLTDTSKLDRLVAEKLEALATEVRGEGWLWVEIQSGESYTDLSKFGRIHSVSAPISDEIRLEIEALQDEQQRIEEKYPEAEEYPPDVHQRMAAIEARIDELNDQPDQLGRTAKRKSRSLGRSWRSKTTVRQSSIADSCGPRIGRNWRRPRSVKPADNMGRGTTMAMRDSPPLWSRT